ncbi:hypothetical protein MNBD_UNCLBAC01-355 [hydrothermal vent metagenome]|uniref:Uncharacterized protein n=1 Tax=hydrothermal vent metagenome TaxID=652676 RepID=A0A3B1DSD6_9ZZZZ
MGCRKLEFRKEANGGGSEGSRAGSPVSKFKVKSDVRGGIDLNPKNINLQTQGQQINYKDPIDPQLLKSLTSSPIDGLAPVILNIIPMMNLPLFLGLKDVQEGDPIR